MNKAHKEYARIVRTLPWLLFGVTFGCGTAKSTGGQTGPAAPIQLDMEPIKIEATTGADGTRIDAFDASELFERGGQALSDKHYDVAAKTYDKLLKEFPQSTYVRPTLYNLGLAHIGRADWLAAVAAFKTLVDRFPSHADAKDSLFQMGACYAEQSNWPASAEVFVRVLERSDLNADDRIEATARRGFAQFNLGDMDAAEKTFRGAMAFKQQIENDERLSTDFYLAFSQYHLGQIFHDRFRKASLRMPETQLDKDLEQKAHLLLTAQRAYIDTIKFGNPGWASAAGFQVGSLYEELYDAFVRVPVPASLNAEARGIYQEELHKKIRILLEKSLRWQRENLLMIERLGVNTDWADKSKLAYAKLLRLLDPNLSNDDDIKRMPAQPGPSTAPPPVPRAPFRGQGQDGADSAPGNKESLQRHVL